MPKPEKIEAVAELKERLTTYKVALATQYKGINVLQATELRRRLRQNGVLFKVYKNTLAARALNELNLAEAVKFMDGPTAWAFSEDPVASAKLLKDFAKEVPLVVLNGGVLEGQVISKQVAESLATMPPKEVLVAQVVGTIAAPLRNLVGALSALPRNLVNVLDQIQKQKAENEGAAA